MPTDDAQHNLGSGTKRWLNIFALNGTIQTSDARLKKAVTNLSYGLRQVLQLRPVTFQWKDHNDGSTYLGLIAQEVEKLIPEAVERNKDPAVPLGMNYTSLVPVLVKAVQEQQTALDQKEAEIQTLNARLMALEQALQKLLEQAQSQAQLRKHQP